MSEELSSAKAERDEAIAHNSQLQAQVTQLQEQLLQAQRDNEEKVLNREKRDRLLAALSVGRQSPIYKRVKAVLDQMML